jgi:hypothetical protein
MTQNIEVEGSHSGLGHNPASAREFSRTLGHGSAGAQQRLEGRAGPPAGEPR